MLREALDRIQMDTLMNALQFPPSTTKGRTRCLICGSTNKTCFSWCGHGFHCFRCEAKGGKLALIGQVLHLERRDAVRWLAATFNLEIGPAMNRAERQTWADRREQDQRDKQEAEYWKFGAIMFWEWILEELPEAVPARYVPTQELLRMKAVRDGAELLTTYRNYRDRLPRFTAAQVYAGERAIQRQSLRLARFIAAGMEVPDAI
jgi:hypothetical protein